MRKQKKNWMLRIMGLVLMLTLVSTCLLSGTLAKYVTTGDGSDTARVAKWGVKVEAFGGMFKDAYDTDDDDYDEIITYSVSASTDVVAPGTSGTAASFGVNGTPEVACLIEVIVDRSASELTGWVDADGDEYEPIVWKVNGNLAGGDGTFAGLLDELDAISLPYAPGVDLSTVTANFAITWEWNFHVDEANDVKDTFLGNLATAPTINLKYDIVVTQID